MKKVILLDHEPWTKRRKQLFYELFEKAGIKLEVWDLSQWLYPGFVNPDLLLNEPYLRKIYSEREFVNLLKKEDSKKTIFVEEVARIYQNKSIFFNLSKLGFDTVKIELYGNTTIKESAKSKLKKFFDENIAHRISLRIKDIGFRIFSRINKIKKPIAVLSSNAFQYRTHCFNHPDYEMYRFEAGERIINGDYIVFCDIFFPLHSDIKFFHKIKKGFDAQHYWRIMRSYFDYLEKRYRMPVVIAAHPKASYNGDEFGGRKIIKYRTYDLVKYSRYVTMHICNTISYTTLMDKPIAYIGTNDYVAMTYIKDRIQSLVKKSLGLRFFNVEDPEYQAEFEFSKIQPDLRRDYIYSYLTSKETENKPNHETLKEILELL